eukprot:640634-Pelagomonas_calceolata.AAC.2
MGIKCASIIIGALVIKQMSLGAGAGAVDASISYLQAYPLQGNRKLGQTWGGGTGSHPLPLALACRPPPKPWQAFPAPQRSPTGAAAQVDNLQASSAISSSSSSSSSKGSPVIPPAVSSSSIPSPSTNTNSRSSPSSTCINSIKSTTKRRSSYSHSNKATAKTPSSACPVTTAAPDIVTPGRKRLTFKHQHHPPSAVGAAATMQNMGGAVKKGQAASAGQDSRAQARKIAKAIKATCPPRRYGTSR